MSLMASNSNIASANRSAVAMWQLPLPVISARSGRTSALESRASAFSLKWPPWFRMRHLLPWGRWWKLQHPPTLTALLHTLSRRAARLTWACAVSRCGYSRFSGIEDWTLWSGRASNRHKCTWMFYIRTPSEKWRTEQRASITIFDKESHLGYHLSPLSKSSSLRSSDMYQQS